MQRHTGRQKWVLATVWVVMYSVTLTWPASQTCKSNNQERVPGHGYTFCTPQVYLQMLANGQNNCDWPITQ